MVPLCGFHNLSFNRDHFAFATAIDDRTIHASKVQYLIRIHWKLQGLILVVQQFNNSFLLYFQCGQDLHYMLSQGSRVLQDYFITLIPWKLNVTWSDLYAHHFPIWIQIHGLPIQFYNIETARYLGGLLGTFIRYDAKSHLNCYGLRFQVLVSKIGLKSINLNRFQLLAVLNVKMSLVLEQVGRLCYSCMNIGHTARNCMGASNFQSQRCVSVMGSRSVSVKYDCFLAGLYISSARMSGIRILAHSHPQKILVEEVVRSHGSSHHKGVIERYIHKRKTSFDLNGQTFTKAEFQTSADSCPMAKHTYNTDKGKQSILRKSPSGTITKRKYDEASTSTILNFKRVKACPHNAHYSKVARPPIEIHTIFATPSQMADESNRTLNFAEVVPHGPLLNESHNYP